MPCLRRRAARGRTAQRGAALLTAMIIVTLVATLAAVDGLAAVARGAGRSRRARPRAVGVDPRRRARLGAPDPARGRRSSGRPTALTNPGPCRSPKRACRPSSPPTRTTPTTRRTPSCPARSPTRRRDYNLRNLVAAGQDRAERAGGAGAPVPGRRRLQRRRGAHRRGAARIALAAAGSGSMRTRRCCRAASRNWPGSASTRRRSSRSSRTSCCCRVRTPVNVNTAPREVLAAVIKGLDLATAERLVQMRQRAPFKTWRQWRRSCRSAGPAERCRGAADRRCVLQLLRGARPPAARRPRARATFAGRAARPRR